MQHTTNTSKLKIKSVDAGQYYVFEGSLDILKVDFVRAGFVDISNHLGRLTEVTHTTSFPFTEQEFTYAGANEELKIDVKSCLFPRTECNFHLEADILDVQIS